MCRDWPPVDDEGVACSVGPHIFNKTQIVGPFHDSLDRYWLVSVRCLPSEYWLHPSTAKQCRRYSQRKRHQLASCARAGNSNSPVALSYLPLSPQSSDRAVGAHRRSPDKLRGDLEKSPRHVEFA